jgi:hypothetical protein
LIDATILQSEETLASDALDIVFVVEVSPATENVLAALESVAQAIIKRLDNNSSDWRAAVVSYSIEADTTNTNDDITIHSPLSSDADQLIIALTTLQLTTTDTTPNNVIAGLVQGLQVDWRINAHQAIVLINSATTLDADPTTDATLFDVMQAAYDAGGVAIHTLLTDENLDTRPDYDALSDATEGQITLLTENASILENLLNAVDAASQPRLYVGQAVQIASLEPTLLLREDPHINADIISELARGTRANITAGPALVCDTGENDDMPLRQLSWWRIETDDGTTGWVTGTSYGEPQIVPYHPEDDLMQTACEISTLSTVNIRQGPALSYPTVANRVGSGQVLAARAQTGNPDQAWRHWWQILEGYWIRAETVSEAEACAQLPFIEAP